MKRKQSLLQAFNLGAEKALVAFCGAGGKSSLMFALAAQLSGRLLITSTTRMASTQIAKAAASLEATIVNYTNLSILEQRKAAKKLILFSGSLNEEKVSGIPKDMPVQLLQLFDFILVEADGARMLPIKAPAEHEPAIPDGTTLVVPVIGIDSLGHPIQETAHRPELLAALLGKTKSDILTRRDLAQVLIDRNGGLKNVPQNARVIPAINKVETDKQLKAARDIAQQILSEPRIEQVVISQAQSKTPVIEVHNRVTGVILAAGQSKRMGRSKQLLPWADTTVLGQTIHHVQDSAVHDILVVAGHEAAAVMEIASAAGVLAVINEQYAQGEMLSSLQTAVKKLKPQIAAVLVMLADQPMIHPETITRLLEAYWQGQGTLIAPTYQGRRGNPVLIDRRHFAELLTLPPGSAPRDLLKQYEVALVAVNSPAVLQDIDSPQDYARLKP